MKAVLCSLQNAHEIDTGSGKSTHHSRVATVERASGKGRRSQASATGTVRAAAAAAAAAACTCF
eukprot:1158491-Pelagomonas_calceolata.AAC.8